MALRSWELPSSSAPVTVSETENTQHYAPPWVTQCPTQITIHKITDQPGKRCGRKVQAIQNYGTWTLPTFRINTSFHCKCSQIWERHSWDMLLPGTMTSAVSQHKPTGKTELRGLSSAWVFIWICTLKRNGAEFKFGCSWSHRWLDFPSHCCGADTAGSWFWLGSLNISLKKREIQIVIFQSCRS